jgi:hypothetical protein
METNALNPLGLAFVATFIARLVETAAREE